MPVSHTDIFISIDPPADREQHLRVAYDNRMRDMRASYPDHMGYSEAWRRQMIANAYGRSSLPAEEQALLPELRSCARCNHRYSIPSGEMGQFFRPYPSGNPRPICRECERQATRERRRAQAARERLSIDGRRFGIELEVNTGLDSERIANALRDAGIECRNPGYSHAVISQWKVVPDSSVAGWEVVSPPMRWQDRDQIHTVCRVLSELGCTPGRQCGLHVHHEVAEFSPEDMRKLLRTWVELQPMHDALTARHRVMGQWSDHFYPREVDTICHQSTVHGMASYSERYKSLNLTCLREYGTVEVRQHESTLDSDKIVAWIAYGQAVIDLALSGAECPAAIVDSATIDALPLKCEVSRRKLKDAVMHGVPDPVEYDGYAPDDYDYDDGW